MSEWNRELVKEDQNIHRQKEENIGAVTEETNRQVKKTAETAEGAVEKSVDLIKKGIRLAEQRPQEKSGGPVLNLEKMPDIRPSLEKPAVQKSEEHVGSFEESLSSWGLQADLSGKRDLKSPGTRKPGPTLRPRGKTQQQDPAKRIARQVTEKPGKIRKELSKKKDGLQGVGSKKKNPVVNAAAARKTVGGIAKVSKKIAAPKVNKHKEQNHVAADVHKLSIEPAKKTIRTSAKMIRKAAGQGKAASADAAAVANPAAPVTVPAVVAAKVIKKLIQLSAKAAKKATHTAVKAGKKLGGAEDSGSGNKGKGAVGIIIVFVIAFGLLFSCSSSTVTTQDHFKYSGRGIGSWPLPKEYDESYISSGFGYRDFDHSFHNGVDFAVPEGTPVYAIRGGTVMQINRCDVNTWPDDPTNTGNCVYIDHGDGLFSIYMHLSAINSKLEVGESVTKGMQIGNSGNTGASAGAHLHLGIRKGEKGCSWDKASYVDPMDYISLEGEEALSETEAHNMFVNMYYGDDPVPSLDDLLELADDRGINRECAYVIIGWCANEGYWAVPTLKGETSQYYFDYLCACCPINYYFDEGIQTGTALAARVAGGDGSGTYAYNALKSKAENIIDGSRIIAYMALMYTDTRVVGCHGMAVPPKESIIAVGRGWSGVKCYAASVNF